MAPSSKVNPMWGGHFDGGPDQLMLEINASIPYDIILYKHDIMGSKAHVKMLAKQGIITDAERDQILDGLFQVEKEFDRGEVEIDYRLEDIHMHVESRLKKLIGDVAGKLHTGRSRNDQVATDVKLWLRDQIKVLDAALQALQNAYVTQAQTHAETILPGFTHLQPAQPITLGHHLLAYVEMLGRDRSRLADVAKRLNECPLGAAALAGTTYPIDRHATSDELGFDNPTRNSLDTVSDRDFAIEFIAAASITMVHLSRFSEELVIWMNPSFGFVKLSDAFTTGSSIMPQKRNPDAAELIRAKTGRVVASLNQLLIVMKGLPLAYSKDMQEDKEPLFDAVTTVIQSVKVMTGMVADMQVNADNMRAQLEHGFVTATDFADYLVQDLKVPFRDAHGLTGKVVRMAEKNGVQLHELSLKDIQSVVPEATDKVFEVLKLDSAIKRRVSYGGTSPENVKQQVEEAKKRWL